MKVFRSVFALRLAIFPVAFSLTLSEEILPENEFENSGELSEHISSFVKEGDHEVVEDLDVVDDENPHPDKSGSSFQKGPQENDLQMDFSLQSKWQENTKDSPLQAPQNDNQKTQNNNQKSEDEDEELKPELIISEVYYDGKDERIEIFNIWDGDFYGDIELSWATSKPQIYTDIQIPAYDFLIIANSDEMFDFSAVNEWNVNILINGNGYPKFQITDTKEIQISLILSWEEVDLFYVHEYRVNEFNDYDMSFQRATTENGFIITAFQMLSKEDRKNLVRWMWILATPWIIIDAPEEVKDCTIDPTSEPEEEEIFESWDCEDVYQSPVTVSEIFRWGSRYEPYIEFDIHDDMEWYDFEYLLLTWSLLKTWVFIDLYDEDAEYFDLVDLEKNTKLILTTKEWSLTEAGLITIVLHPDFELNFSGWSLELYWIGRQDRQVLDIVKIWAWTSEKSVYHWHLEYQCWDNMDNMNDFSPGFDESALRYFSVTSKYNEKVIETVKYVWWWGGCSCPSKAELCGTATWDTQDSSAEPQNDNNPETPMDSSDESSEWQINTQDSSFHSEWQAVKIVSLESKTPESITLQSFLPYDIDFKNHNYYLKTSTATTKKYIDGILYANTIDTFSKNFWFVDAGACVYLYSWNLQLDSYCYSSEKDNTEKEEKAESFNPSDYQISITDILYDPDWSDTWNETITIQSNSSKPLDLSKIKMKVNATNKRLTWILDPHSSITLKWTFWFPNSTKDGSDVIVVLFHENHIFSTYTYNPNKPKVEIPQWAVKVYSVIDGDTFRYRKEDGSLQSVRLLGVDSPESNTARYRSTECFWKEAKNYLTNLIKNQYVTLEFDSNSASSDAYGRMLAYVYLDGKLVNETLIAEWYAKEYTYKTPYTYQSAFRQSEENAKKSEKWLRSASTCWKSIAEEPEAWGIDYEKLSIKIQSVIYDPEWSDSWNEIVQLTVDNSQISTVTSIDFSDDFSLTIFPRSEYATWTTKTKKLTEFWIFDLFSSSSQITLKWNFQLPNNRATCVSINQWSYTFDTRCYNPDQPLSDENLSGNSALPDVKILSIVPNPSGKDSWKEEITLLRTPSDDFPDYMSSLELSPDFSLLINWKTKKKLAWNLTANQSITIKWTFSLPNSASCVSLLFSWTEIDKFCYSKPSDGVKFNSDNTSVHEIPEEELAIVKKITLVKQWDKLCVSYNKTIFSCKSIPNSTTEKNKKQLSMQNTFISQLEKYIKSNYSMLYYDSNIKDYFELHSSAKKAIKSWDVDFVRKERKISLTDIASLFPKTYDQDAKDYFVSQISSVMPEHISLALLQIGNDYSDSLAEKSDLDFLSLAE